MLCHVTYAIVIDVMPRHIVPDVLMQLRVTLSHCRTVTLSLMQLCVTLSLTSLCVTLLLMLLQVTLSLVLLM